MVSLALAAFWRQASSAGMPGLQAQETKSVLRNQLPFLNELPSLEGLAAFYRVGLPTIPARAVWWPLLLALLRCGVSRWGSLRFPLVGTRSWSLRFLEARCKGLRLTIRSGNLRLVVARREGLRPAVRSGSLRLAVLSRSLRLAVARSEGARLFLDVGGECRRPFERVCQIVWAEASPGASVAESLQPVG